MKNSLFILILLFIFSCSSEITNNEGQDSKEAVPMPLFSVTTSSLYGFESGTQSWTGQSVSGGPWSVSEWSVQGSKSLKANVNLSSSSVYYLKNTSNDDFSGNSTLVATVKHASWGNHGSGMNAKLYVKTGSGWQWFDGGSTSINANTSGTLLSIDLTNVSNLGQIKEVGVQFTTGSVSSGSSAIYVDKVELTSNSGGAVSITPVTPNYSSQVNTILNNLANLPNGNDDRIVSGQFLGYSGFGFSTGLLSTINTATNYYPGIAGVDIANGGDGNRNFLDVFDHSANADLVSHWNSGGLITVNHHFPNPLRTNGKAGMGATGRETTTNINNMLYGPNSNNADKDRWYDGLWEVYTALLDMKNRGITVIYRPLHEMNGDWFWYGGLGTSSRPNSATQDYKNLWSSVFEYMTTSKGSGYPALDNIIWVYSPDYSRSGVTNYIVSDETDIVALDAYLNDPETNTTLYNRYISMLSLNKPFAFGEIGPQNNRTDGQFDYTKWLNAMKNKYGEAVYFLAWNDFGSVKIAPTSNLNAFEFYNDYDWLLNRGEQNLK